MPQAVNACVIFAMDDYFSWQLDVLRTLKSALDVRRRPSLTLPLPRTSRPTLQYLKSAFTSTGDAALSMTDPSCWDLPLLPPFAPSARLSHLSKADSPS